MSAVARTPEETGVLLSFDASGAELRVVDHIERRQCTFEAGTPVEPREVSPEEFFFPIDRGVRVTTDSLTLAHTSAAFVRNHAGLMIDQVSQGEYRDLPEDLYSIELPTSIKLYVVAETALTIDVDRATVRIDFGGATDVYIGARSHHDNPAATITTTTSPTDVMEALSYFGSALKTTTCERSYPTLRGHPPLIERGRALDVPTVLERPQIDVQIEVPAALRPVFTVAPLAYYLGAEVVPGETPAVVTGAGFRHPLEHPERGFEDEVARVLKQTLFLDCLVRTEGIYKVDLHERNELEEHLGLDFHGLYDVPMAEQLETYLDVPYSVVRPHVPRWPLSVAVESPEEYLEALPFLTDDLAVFGSPAFVETEETEMYAEAIDEFTRNGAMVRRTNYRENGDPASSPSVIELEDSEALEQVWLGDDVPSAATKGMTEAFRNRLDRTPTDDDIDITVVVNDPEMESEGNAARTVYGSREDLPFDVSVSRQVTTDRLRELLHRDTDFFHYIGHIDADGFECPDGSFDAATLSDTDVDAFFLNACTSYRQGMHLIDAGAIAAVVTLHDVIDSGAERVGRMLARLLNQGFPFQPALEIAKERSIMGGRYLLVGDGRLDIVQPERGTPATCEVEKIDDKFKLEYVTFLNSRLGVGSMTVPHIGGNDQWYLTSGLTGEFSLSRQELDEFVLEQEELPVKYEGKYVWSTELELD